MNRASVGIACVLTVFLGNATADVYTRGDDPAQHQRVQRVLVADSNGNPWAIPDQNRRQRGLPEYITNPKYATQEDVETKLDYGKKQIPGGGVPQQQPRQPGYGAPPGVPAVPNIYAPYSGVPYGYQPGYPMYPGFGTLPGMGTPYTGDTGFGGNPLITPYGNIYGPVRPYQGTEPSSGE